MSAPGSGAGALGIDGWRARLDRLVVQPAMAAGAALVRRAGPSGVGPLGLYAAYTLVIFIVFVIATLPHELVLRRALDLGPTAPITVDLRGVRLGWTMAYTVDELRLQARGGDPSLPVFSASRVHAAPSIFGLFRGRPFPLALAADLYGGSLDATLDLDPDAYDVRAKLASLDLGRYAGLRQFLEGTLQGRVGGSIDLAGNPTKPATTGGLVDLRGTDVALEGGRIRGVTIPDLHFPELHLAGTIKAGRVDLDDLNVRGREVTVAGDGTLLLAHPLAATLINLDLTLTAAPDLPDNLRIAFNLIPGDPTPAGERKLHLFGTLTQPKLK